MSPILRINNIRLLLATIKAFVSRKGLYKWIPPLKNTNFLVNEIH
jgi:hypothetical protein